MLEIFLLLVPLLAMAHTPRRGGYPRHGSFGLRRVRVSPAIILSTLGSQTVLTSALVGTSDAQYRLIASRLSWSQLGLTAAEGPITVGYAFGDYTVAEIKECIEIGASISTGDKIAQEKANRWVRIVGTFEADAQSVLNNGNPIKTRLNWAVQIGSAVNIFAYNESAGALATGTIVNAQGDLWVKDY